MAKNVDIKVGLQQSGFQRGIGKVKRGLSGLVSKAKSAAGMFGMAMGGAAVIAGLRGLVNELDNIAKTAQRIGVTTDAMQKLKIASELSGNSISTIQTAFKRMSAVVYDAMRGLKGAKDSLDAIGLSVDDLQGKGTEEMFEIIAGKLRLVSNESEKSALAQKLFGRSGQELIPLINTYKEIAEEAENTGAIIEESSIKAAEKFNDNLTKATAKVKSRFVSFGASAMSVLGDFQDAFQDMNDMVFNDGKMGGTAENRENIKAYEANQKKIAQEKKIKEQKEATAKAEQEASAIAIKNAEKQIALSKKLNEEIIKRSGGKKDKMSADGQEVLKGYNVAEKEAYIAKLNEQDQIFSKSLQKGEEEIYIQEQLAAGNERAANMAREQFALRASMGRNLTKDEMKALSEKHDRLDYIKAAKEKELALEKEKVELERSKEKAKQDFQANAEKDIDYQMNDESNRSVDSFAKMGLQIGGAANIESEKSRNERRNKLLEEMNTTMKERFGGDDGGTIE